MTKVNGALHGMQMLKKLLESYIVILLLSLSAGLAFPNIGARVAPYVTLFLQIIFFLSSLKLDIHAVKKDGAHVKEIFLVNTYMLVIFPVITFAVTHFLAPAYTLPLVLLAAMPAGMTSMLLTELVGGRVTLALLLTMTTSLLAPVTVPLVLRLLVGTTVSVPFLPMFLSLLKVIVAPFLLAQIVRHLAHEKIKATFFTFKPVSIVLLGLLIFGVVAKQAPALTANLRGFLPALGILIVFFFLLHLAGYFGIPGLKQQDRLATTVCLTYMNFTLAIYLAGKFFPEPQTLIPVILSVFPWSIGMIPFQTVVKRHVS